MTGKHGLHPNPEPMIHNSQSGPLSEGLADSPSRQPVYKDVRSRQEAPGHVPANTRPSSPNVEDLLNHLDTGAALRRRTSIEQVQTGLNTSVLGIWRVRHCFLRPPLPQKPPATADLTAPARAPLAPELIKSPRG